MYRYLLLCSVFIFVGCAETSSDKKNEDKQGVEVQNSFAEAFRITHFDDYIQIDVINPETKEVDFEYVIGRETATTQQIPLPKNPSRVIALSATHIGMMEELDLSDRIVGVSSADYVCSEKVLTQIQHKKTVSLGDIGSSDIEGFIAASPDLIMTSGFDNKAPILKKMKSAGLTLFTNYDWKETHPLGRAEWIKVFGILFNEEDRANELFTEIQKKYIDVVQKVATASSRPTVLVGTMYGDVFNAPAGDSYMAKLLADANVDYVYARSTGVGSLSLTLEDVISNNRKTDFWLNPAAQNIEQLLQMNARFKLLVCVEKEKVYSYYKHINCFWEQSAIQPHLVLQELCFIFYPELFNFETYNYYNKLMH
jgi:iron complex transport system substrate-binding protein